MTSSAPRSPPPPPEFDGSMNRLEELLGEVERRASPEALETVRELVRTLLEVHRPGLSEMLETLGAHGTEETFRALCDSPSVATLLLMHDLHPQSVEERVKRALREAHDAAGHDARAEILRIDGNRVFVRMHGDKDAGTRLLRRALERVALERAPDAVLEIEGGEAPPEPGLIPVARLVSRGGTAAE